MKKIEKKVKVLDSSYILHSNLDFSDFSYVVTESVLNEIKDETARLMIELGIKKGSIKVIDPSEKSKEKIKKVAKRTGDFEEISNADIDVLALALEKNFTLLTDDYRIQNIASILKLKFEKFQQRGIEKKLIWRKICEGCGKIYKEGGKVCKICGSTLKKISKPFE